MRGAIQGTLQDIQALYKSVDSAQEQVVANIRKIKAVIDTIEKTHEYYIRALKPLD